MKKARFMLKGGLGNQLFQLSCMLDVRQKTGFNPEYSTLSLEHDCLRDLEILGLLNSAAFQGVDSNFFLKKSRFIYRLYKKILQVFSSRYLRENAFGSLDVLDELHDRKESFVYIDGYFQSIDHVLRNIDKLRALLFENINLNSESLYYKKIIERSECSVSLHVRRGDYVSNVAANKHHGLCGPNYYKSAVQEAKNNSNSTDVEFFVFSDDLDWCKTNIDSIGLNENDSICFIERKLQADSFQDMLLMSYCESNILANSTYSWWAGVLNNKSCKGRVIVPKKWFENDDVNKGSLFLSEWILK